MKKIISKVLIALMLCSTMPVNAIAETINKTSITGNVDLFIKLNHPIKDNQNADMKVTLSQNGKVVKEVSIEPGKNIDSYYEQNNNTEKGEYANRYLISIPDIKQGTYDVSISGNGYTEVKENFILDTHNKYIEIGEGNIKAGDINGDEKIDEKDLLELEKELASKTPSSLYDLNRDGKVDVEDVAYIYHNQNISAEAIAQKNTSLIPEAVGIKPDKIEESLNDKGIIVREGTIDNLFDDSAPVTFESEKAISQENPIEIPIVMASITPIQQVSIELGQENAPSTFYVIVEDDNGNEISIPYGSQRGNQKRNERRKKRSTSSMMNSMTTNKSGKNVINIDLGKKIPVKKVTIKLTGTENDGKLATIGKVEFLEDIVTNAQPPDEGIVKNLQAKAGDEEVTLTWSQISNVTSYRIQYGTESGNYANSLVVENNTSTIQKLKNFTTYYFVVTALNGEWEGKTSKEVTATPKPKDIPLKPDNVSVKPGDKRLYVSWGKSEGATHYNLYYKKTIDNSYTKIENVKPTYTLPRLENDTEYTIYVTALNELGESSPSLRVKGTPEEPKIEIPDVPTFNLINNPNNNETGIKTNHIEKVEMVKENNVQQSEYPEGFTINNVVDGDFKTHWTARAWWESHGMTITFDKPYEMDHLAYITRLDGEYKKYLSRYSITIWEDENSEPKKIVSGSEIPYKDRTTGLHILTFPKSTVKKITVEAAQWDGAGAVTASELMFYEYYSLDEDIRALFKDNTFTELREGVTLEEIESIEAMVNNTEERFYINSKIYLEELAMAKNLLNGSNDKLGTVIDVYQGRNASLDSNREFAMTLNEDQPLGLVTEKNKEVVVYVETTNNTEMPSLVFTQYFGEASSWRQEVPLVEGRNIIKTPQINSLDMPHGGSMYVNYNGSSQEQIKIHVKGATKIPMLSELYLRETHESIVKERIGQYIDELTTYVNSLRNIDNTTHFKNSTEIETKQIMLSMPADQILKGIENGLTTKEEKIQRVYDTLLALEEMMDMHYKIRGLSEDAVESKNNLPSSRINIRYMRMFGKAFMYAGGAHIGIGYNSVPALMKGKPLSTGDPQYFGWGINHEIGHVLDFSKFSFVEITNNIFSLFAQTINGNESRLEGISEEIYSKVTSGSEGMANNVFVALAMFWQLHLAYDDDNIVDTDDFYGRISRAYRDNSESVLCENGKLNLFVRMASDVTGKDLRNFFKQWGIAINNETDVYLDSKNYPVEHKKIYYLNDSAFRYRVEKGISSSEDTSLNVGNVTMNVTASVKNLSTSNKAIEINIDTENSATHPILGYEISRNGKVVAFVQEPVFIDNVGAANNRSYEYTVKAYDYLLNEVGTAKSQSVKVEFDGTVNKDKWTVNTTTSSGIVIDMNELKSISGIKFKDIKEGSHNYTVKVQGNKIESTTGSSIEIPWIIAKEGVVDTAEFSTYFNKPGAPNDDTRIWTYDARYVLIEGIPDLTLDNIDIVEYPGDNIDITNGAIGKLGHELRYGHGEDDVIKKDTVIIAGTYRGDPVYNIIKPKGLYQVGGHGTTEYEERVVNGFSLMFAEIPEDGEVSTISDGIWIYVPEDDIVPDKVKVELYRVDDPETLEGERLVSDTVWVLPSNEETMPTINFTSSNGGNYARIK